MLGKQRNGNWNLEVKGVGIRGSWKAIRAREGTTDGTDGFEIVLPTEASL